MQKHSVKLKVKNYDPFPHFTVQLLSLAGKKNHENAKIIQNK